MSNTITSKSGRKLGRPIKLDDAAIRNRLVELIAKGLPFSHACNAVGVVQQTFITFRDKNEWFKQEIAEAVASAIEKRLGVIEKASDLGDTTSAKWLLEHLHPESFARNRVSVEVSGKNGESLAPIIQPTVFFSMPEKQPPKICPNPPLEIDNGDAE